MVGSLTVRRFNQDGRGAPQAVGWATFITAVYTCQAGNRPVPSPEPLSGLQSRRPSSCMQCVPNLEGESPSEAESKIKSRIRNKSETRVKFII